MFESFKIESLTFQYTPASPILKGIYLNASASEIVGISGQNGAGKSTLFNALTIFNEMKGSVFINDIYVPPKNLIKEIAYLPQVPFLPKEKKVKSVVKMFPLSKEKQTSIFADERISLLQNQRISTLSGGEKRYLEFLLINNLPKNIVILDEPFSEIEPIYEEKICNQILENSKTRLYLISDHNISTLKKLCTRILVLKNGYLEEV